MTSIPSLPDTTTRRSRVDLAGLAALARLQRFVTYLTMLQPWHAGMVLATTGRLEAIRRHFAGRYLRGHGIEIGAQTRPTRPPNASRIDYIDLISADETSQRYGLDAAALVPLTHIADSTCLAMYADRSLDFVIANHVLEHLDNPLGGLIEWLRVLRPGGKLFLSVPNYRANEYDFTRQPPPLDHLVADHESRDRTGFAARNRGHFEEFVVAAELPPGDPRFQDRILDLIEREERIHFHVYDWPLVESLVALAGKHAGRSVRIMDSFRLPYGYEFVAVIRVDGSGRRPWRRGRWRDLALIARTSVPPCGPVARLLGLLTG
jgi:SAM-dependent methyltransferase